ncbi:MAG: substrate-binding domain-containing protein [Dethiobacteria bacterium]|jgi:molybdate/tungstate transport system substrate-binding protein|nr:solute-binding protein [Bacillota bacterium]
MKNVLRIYHAGSLNLPFSSLEEGFNRLFPHVRLQRTAGGSVELAKQIRDAGDPVDLFASADYAVVDNLLISGHADWNLLFARNSLVLLYSAQSKYAEQVNSDNWIEILRDNNVYYAQSNPEKDPVGYRTLLMWQLAERYYAEQGLYNDLIKSERRIIAEGSAKLVSMLEDGKADYIFEYESVARQLASRGDSFCWLKLPPAIDLSDYALAHYYRSASVLIKDHKEQAPKKLFGEPIVYSLTIPKTVTNLAMANAFLKFLFEKNKGIKIMREAGLPLLERFIVYGHNIPFFLQFNEV